MDSVFVALYGVSMDRVFYIVMIIADCKNAVVCPIVREPRWIYIRVIIDVM